MLADKKSTFVRRSAPSNF